MGKVKAMYAEMEERNNWKEADKYYEEKDAKLLAKLKYHNDDHMLQSEIEENLAKYQNNSAKLRDLDTLEPAKMRDS